MTSYPDIRKRCEESSAISKSVIDEFLIYYAAAREGLEATMQAHFKKYKKAVRDLPESQVNYLKAEFLAHRIFRRDGLVKKYLDRPEIKNLPPEQYRYLEFQSQHPWRFSFAEIRHSPAPAFFEMEDVFSGDTYLLYSPGMQATAEESRPRLWLNLVGFNGHCWQTFGLIIPFRGFNADDIFFFATELNPKIEDDDMLLKEVESNPIPFFMLLAGSGLPVVVARGFETALFLATDGLEEFATEKLSGHFTVAWNKNVFRLTSKTHGEFPHFAAAWYNEQKKELVRTAMTLAGFEELTKALAKGGYDLDLEAEIAVSPAMVSLAGKILDRKIVLNPYEGFFPERKDEIESESLKKINHFLKLALPYYNAKQEPDIKKLAKEAGIEEEEALSVWEAMKKDFQKTGKKI